MYPYDAPATQISGYWSQGAYTPSTVVAYIKDNFTPIDKNSMMNSVGRQISLLENFVNTTYLARSGEYVQDGYIKNIHTGHLISSGWYSPDNIGKIYLCSQLYPSADNAIYLGEYKGESNKHRWAGVAAYTLTTRFLSGHIGGLGGFIMLQSDITPEVTNDISLGTSTRRFGSVMSSGMVSSFTQTTYLVSNDHTSQYNPGNILLCSNIKPNITGLILGNDVPFSEIYTKDLFLTHLPTAFPGGSFQVWSSGGVLRIGV